MRPDRAAPRAPAVKPPREKPPSAPPVQQGRASWTVSRPHSAKCAESFWEQIRSRRVSAESTRRPRESQIHPLARRTIRSQHGACAAEDRYMEWQEPRTERNRHRYRPQTLSRRSVHHRRLAWRTGFRLEQLQRLFLSCPYRWSLLAVSALWL